jgi:DNA repair photolyase
MPHEDILTVNSDKKNNQEFQEKATYQKVVNPVIISASRATDIPKWYSDWFINRLKIGYVIWINPFNQNYRQKVTFKDVQAIVFWSKDPKPFMKHLDFIDSLNIGYYFQYSLNDYEKEGLEPNLPPLERRIQTFIELSNKIGKEKVIWRFDPLILSDSLTTKDLLSRIEKIGGIIHEYTEKLVISFVDIEQYNLVKKRLKKLDESYREFNSEEKHDLIKGLYLLNKKWGLTIATCCEDWTPDVPFSKYDIEQNRCIDDVLLRRLFPEKEKLMNFLNTHKCAQTTLFQQNDNNLNPLKDPNQRKNCGCIISKDIGQYETCVHLCKYCYANKWDKKVRNRYEKYLQSNHSNESII